MGIEDIELGHDYRGGELKSLYRQIYGGVSWPDKRPGFAVVLGVGHKKRFDSYPVYLLDEFESEDMGELVRQCGALQYKYQPEMWAGDRLNDAADRLINEMNRANKPVKKEDKGWWRNPLPPARLFYVSATPILDMKCPYPYMLSELKQLLNPDHRLLFLKDGKVAGYLSGLEASEISTFNFGDFPAIEALAFAAIEIRHRARWFDEFDEDSKQEDATGSYAIQSAL